MGEKEKEREGKGEGRERSDKLRNSEGASIKARERAIKEAEIKLET